MTNFNIQAVHAKIDKAMSQLWFNLDVVEEIPVSDELIRRIKRLHKQREMEQALSIPTTCDRRKSFEFPSKKHIKPRRLAYDDIIFANFNIHVYYLEIYDKLDIIDFACRESKFVINEEVPFFRFSNENELYFIANYPLGANIKYEKAQGCEFAQSDALSYNPNVFASYYDGRVV